MLLNHFAQAFFGPKAVFPGRLLPRRKHSARKEQGRCHVPLPSHPTPAQGRTHGFAMSHLTGTFFTVRHLPGGHARAPVHAWQGTQNSSMQQRKAPGVSLGLRWMVGHGSGKVDTGRAVWADANGACKLGVRGTSRPVGELMPGQ